MRPAAAAPHSRPAGAMMAAGRSRDARLLLAGVAVDAFGTGLTLPFLVVYLHAVRSIPLETVGLIVAVPAAVALVLLGPVGVLVDRVGPRRVVMVSLAAAATAALLMSRVETAAEALVARVLAGIAAAGFWPANDALVASVIPSEIRQRYYGVSFALLNAGIGAGGIIAAVYVDVARPDTFATVYRADALTFVVPLVLFLVPLRHVGGPAASTVAAKRGGGYGVVLRDRAFRRLLILTFVSTFAGYGQIEGGWPAFANAIARVPARTLGIAFAANTAVIVALQVVVLRFIDGRRRTRMLALQMAFWAAAWAILGTSGLVPATPLASVLVVTAFSVFALGETLQSPVLPALRNDLAPEALRGRYNAAASLAFQLAQISAPAVAGIILGADRGDLFIGMLLAGCLLAAVLTRQLERVLPASANGVPPALDAADGEDADVRRARRAQRR